MVTAQKAAFLRCFTPFFLLLLCPFFQSTFIFLIIPPPIYNPAIYLEGTLVAHIQLIFLLGLARVLPLRVVVQRVLGGEVQAALHAVVPGVIASIGYI